MNRRKFVTYLAMVPSAAAAITMSVRLTEGRELILIHKGNPNPPVRLPNVRLSFPELLPARYPYKEYLDGWTELGQWSTSRYQKELNWSPYTRRLPRTGARFG